MTVDPLGELAARLGYALDPAQVTAMGEAVAAAEPHAAALRGIPVPPEAADPAYGEAWLAAGPARTEAGSAKGVGTPRVGSDGRAGPAGGRAWASRRRVGDS